MEESQKKWLWIMIALVALVLVIYMFSKPAPQLSSIDSGQTQTLQTADEALQLAEQNNDGSMTVVGTAEPLEDEISNTNNQEASATYSASDLSETASQSAEIIHSQIEDAPSAIIETPEVNQSQ